MWLLLGDPAGWTDSEQAYLRELFRIIPDLLAVHTRIHQFLAMMANQAVEAWPSWLHAAEHSGYPELESFAGGLRLDSAAVVAALSVSWSNGQVEGQVNRLKMVKRTMFGRAGFALLRQRMIDQGHRSETPRM